MSTDARDYGATMGDCSVCGRRFYLRKNGTVWHHAKYPSWTCGGAGQPPRAAAGVGGADQ